MPQAVAIVYDLVGSGASADYGNSAALHSAMKIKDTTIMLRIMQRLFDSQPRRDVANAVFPYIFKTGHSSKIICQILDMFIQNTKNLDVIVLIKNMDHVLFLWLNQREYDIQLLTKLLAAGATIDQPKSISFQSSAKPEAATLLIHVSYASLTTSVTLEVIKILIKYGANVNFRPKYHPQHHYGQHYWRQVITMSNFYLHIKP